MANDQFRGFGYGQAFGQGQNLSFPGPPTPPNQPGYNSHYAGRQQNAYGGGANGASQSVQLFANGDAPGPSKSDTSAEDGGTRLSDDEDLTPAQSRRKAQNRAA